MSLWYQIKSLYTLDTLDTRLTATSEPTTKLVKNENDNVVHKSSSAQDKDAGTGRQQGSGRPPKWKTLEYFLYCFVVMSAVPMMIYVGYSVSRASDPEYPRYEPLLSPGWIPGRKVDNSDQQYAGFRDNIPYMAIVVLIHPLLRIFLNRITQRLLQSDERDPDAAFKARRMFDIGFAVIFTFVLHGFSAFKIFLILYSSFMITRHVPKPWIPAATWIFNVGVLFANEYFNGYPYSRLAKFISFSGSKSASSKWAETMDSYGGLIPRWEILFKITTLRLISFNIDYYWSLDRQGSTAIEKKQLNPSLLSEKERISTPAPSHAYNFANMFAYALYSPLYIAGPILTFNDHLTQMRHRPPSITTRRIVLYAVRFLLTLLTMELTLHFIYAVAISKSNPNWSHYTPFQLSMLGYHNLHIIWLKLLLPWRFFRLWALIDGMDPPENMVRCMSDNYSILAFWRGWHRSFNRWIVRYLYVPLGGAGRGTPTSRSLLNLLLVFTFVALWHDLSLQLLTWSWLIIIFLMPELICSTVLFPAKNFKNKPETYRFLCATGAVGNILMMMAANLVGFAVGLDGLQSMVASIMSGWEGWTFLLAACATLFVGSMVMFEIREDEKRRGIDLRY
ncbi:MAG: glycerol transporter [Alyxoria varia]|nr:MAG: glycerol transporter [Alyxoria varia]